MVDRFCSNLKQFRKEKGLTQTQLATMINLRKTTISNYETGFSSPDKDTLVKLANIFEVSVDKLLGRNKVREVSSFPPPPKEKNMPYFQSPIVKIPILGIVRSGDPLVSEQSIIDFLNIPEEYLGRGEFFAIKVIGDSMNMSKIDDGDLVIAKRTDIVKDGDIAVVLVDGEKATVKHYYKDENIVTLIPHSSNRLHKPRSINAKKCDVKILGKVIRAIVEL